MSVLIFEWLSSGGLWLDGESPAAQCPIQNQGRQMLNAVTADLTAGGLNVLAMVDSRLPNVVVPQQGLATYEVGFGDDLPKLLLKLAEGSDWVLVIAPETDSILARCLSWLQPVKQKLLNPDLGFTRLASNKSELFEFLDSKGFERFPRGGNFQGFPDRAGEKAVGLPAVLKPADGAGSEEVFLIRDWSTFKPRLSRPNDQYRLEEFVPGTAVSVSVLCGGDQYDVLTPTVQLFHDAHAADEIYNAMVGHYVGAGFPVAADLSARAVELACEVLELLPPIKGYIGMDLVISDSEDASHDRLIEINPRLTMSYVRLTQLYGQQLACDHESSTRTSGPIGWPNLGMRMISQASKPSVSGKLIRTFRAPCP